MARKERNSVDYFPHPVNHGKKMFYLRSKFKNDGYSVWFMLLEELGKAEYHYLDLSNKIQLMYLSSSFMVDENVLKDIIDILVDFEEFDKDLWHNNSILFNEKFIENIQDAYKKRNNDCINKETLLVILQSKGIPLSAKSIPKQIKCNPKGDLNPQSIVKNSKLNNIIERKQTFLEDLKPFVETYGKDMMNEFYKYWTEDNKSGTKFKMELEETWDTKKRLERWAKNDFSKNKTTEVKPIYKPLDND